DDDGERDGESGEGTAHGAPLQPSDARRQGCRRSAGLADDPEAVRGPHELLLDRRRLAEKEAARRVPEAVAAREPDDRPVAFRPEREEVHLDVEVLRVREVAAERVDLR